ncbi:MAG: hypothetical protein WCZ19_03160 [Acholeplasma sp.]
MKYLIKLWNQSKVVRYRLDDLTTMQSTLFSVLGSLVATTILVLPLYLILVQLFMFVDIHIVLIILLFVLSIIAVFIYEYLMYYISGLIEPKIKKLYTKSLVIVEGSIISLLFVVVGIIFVVIFLQGV